MAKKRTYTIEVYELHTSKYIVEATSLPQALQVYQNGGADLEDDSQEYIETADRYGIPLAELECSEAESKRLQAEYGDTLPGIRSIEVE